MINYILRGLPLQLFFGHFRFKKLPKFFDIIVQNSKNSRFKQAKIV